MCVYLITRYLDIGKLFYYVPLNSVIKFLKNPLTAEKKRLDCGRSIAVFLTGIRFALQNPIDFSAFVGSIGDYLKLFKYVGTFFYCSLSLF